MIDVVFKLHVVVEVGLVVGHHNLRSEHLLIEFLGEVHVVLPVFDEPYCLILVMSLLHDVD
eukprot:UN33913